LKYRRDFAKTRPESDYRRLFREGAARRRVLHPDAKVRRA
jgi:hypothetical protein